MTTSLHLDLGLLLLLLGCWRTPGMAGATVPAAPVNVSVTQLRQNSAMVTWNVPQGDTVIGYAISQQTCIDKQTPNGPCKFWSQSAVGQTSPPHSSARGALALLSL
ncbi:hypothetical protein Q5P01_005782 [Channa striata]|uniref:Fibronectin type-III domain-containing protein n=1 Tax=Channa striata TaxID=64152 RepID=A0AA88NH13_CHASR|nr:hypothetical protein Q5P01_005782 [Channa striata]